MTNQFIIIEGNIGAGKTTLAQKLASDLDAHLLLEKFNENPFLPKFYSEPRQHALPLELSFLAERYSQIKNITIGNDLFKSNLIADYFIYKSLVFSKINLTEIENELYVKLFSIIHERSPKPDLLVYLFMNTPRLLKNIMKRGRAYEQHITEEYLLSIQNSYLSYLHKVEDFPVLILDINNLDFVTNDHDYQKIKNYLKKSYPKGVTNKIIEK
jgi:deoxyguanosine kinase